MIFNALDYSRPLIPSRCEASSINRLAPSALLRRNLLIWGLGGVILPFIGIKVIDVVIYPLMVAMHMT